MSGLTNRSSSLLLIKRTLETITSPSISFFDGPPVVSCTAYCVHEGRLTKPADAFDHPFWDYIRDRISEKAVDIRREGFFGNAMLPYSELEYGGIVKKLQDLEERFQVREK